MIEYKLKGTDILKDGHTMFLQDVVKDLNRTSYAEELIIKYRTAIRNHMANFPDEPLHGDLELWETLKEAE